jgi:hypothetical protein
MVRLNGDERYQSSFTSPTSPAASSSSVLFAFPLEDARPSPASAPSDLCSSFRSPPYPTRLRRERQGWMGSWSRAPEVRISLSAVGTFLPRTGRESSGRSCRQSDFLCGETGAAGREQSVASATEAGVFKATAVRNHGTRPRRCLVLRGAGAALVADALASTRRQMREGATDATD